MSLFFSALNRSMPCQDEGTYTGLSLNSYVVYCIINNVFVSKADLSCLSGVKCLTETEKGLNVMNKSERIHQITDAMSRNGLRVTDQRRTLAQIFTDDEGYLSPKDVYDKMKQQYPSVSFDTVYRNLRLLSEMGVLEQYYFLDGGLKFKGCCSTHHHHHLICLSCEKTLPLDYCPMDQSIDLPANFKISNHRFEIYGLCDQCQ